MVISPLLLVKSPDTLFQTKSVLQINLLGNTTFLIAISASILALFGLIYVPFLQAIFQTEALNGEDICMLVALGSTVLIVDECCKLFLRNFVYCVRNTAGKDYGSDGCKERLLP